MSDFLNCDDYRSSMSDFFREAVDFSMSESDSVFARIEGSELPEHVKNVTVDVGDASTVSPSIHLERVLDISDIDIIEGNFEELHGMADEVAQSYLDKFMPAFFDHIGGVAEAVGNSIDCNGVPFSWDSLLDAMEQVEWSEDEYGIAHPPALVVGENSTLREQLKYQTLEQRERWASIIVKKQEESVSRRRSRRLR